ncbi:MAG: DUF1294 domain-containing protein [Verrucomicrobia bacterium]|nr:DUF1294 domain-containing protein [Verrucomicrobiota bacterium]
MNHVIRCNPVAQVRRQEHRGVVVNVDEADGPSPYATSPRWFIHWALAKSGRLLSGLLVLPGLAMLWLPVPWWMGAGVMTVISAITYGMYADDQQRAASGAWRVPESSLHLAELLGGWPGAFLAQRRLRHKSSKVSYQVVFWLIVVIFQIVAAEVMQDQRLSQALMRYMAR